MKSIKSIEDVKKIKLPLTEEGYQALFPIMETWMEWPREIRLAFQEMDDKKCLEKYGEY